MTSIYLATFGNSFVARLSTHFYLRYPLPVGLDGTFCVSTVLIKNLKLRIKVHISNFVSVIVHCYVYQSIDINVRHSFKGMSHVLLKIGTSFICMKTISHQYLVSVFVRPYKVKVQ